MEMEILFPDISQIPEALKLNFQQMMDKLHDANSRDELTKYNDMDHIFQIVDAEGVVRCLFKINQDEEDVTLTRTEASAYPLDHPIDGPRWSSPTIYGFAGVLPAICLRFRHFDGQMYSGVLVEFRNDVTGEIHEIIDTMRLNMEEVHKIALADVRFGNMDRNGHNILVAIEENGLHLIPIDHGMCFIEKGQGYSLCGPYWLKNPNKCRINEALSEECISYVGSLNVDADIAFLRRCGWDFPEEYIEKFKILTTFLKKAVAQGFTLLHIGNMASFSCNDSRFTLKVIVESEKMDFMTRVENRIDELLKGYNNKIC